MTSVYNQLYDNDAYCALAQAIADHMDVNYDSPTQEYLDVMVAIQDRMIGFVEGKPYLHPMPAIIATDSDLWHIYNMFSRPYMEYYFNEKQY